ncbi:hypothetical protein PSACC_01031 [Paramicrosporidium saccamoebae]|uniref:Uncharacterized protein n=1 Tax=Paramicrosporidium saccamoebae TaxID=1246581 RepID=A0A2H9TN90_9FUNG|nr:hypothetical protein PSACC_01031 [Paramicrosporidium saccamoebae]
MLRWASGEFLIYYAVLAFAMFTVFQSAYNFSLPTNLNFTNYSHNLRAGWMGRPMDNSDAQWRSFREPLPLAILLFGGFLALNGMARMIGHRRAWSFDFSMRVRAALTLAFLIVLHGLHTIKILVLVGGNFLISSTCKGKRINVIFTWIYNIGLLFALEYFKVSYRDHPLLSIAESFFNLLPAAVPRWSVTFNITILRLISYNVDYYYSFQGYSALQHREGCKECSDNGNGDPCDRRRIQEAPSRDSFTFINCLIYVLYPPLYLAGPIITFNNFYSQIQRPMRPSTMEVLTYALRWVVSFLTIEVMLHYCYVVAIKNNQAWIDFRPLDFAALSYLNLTVVWLKLLIIWRFFRLVALFDGIVPLENMARCMTNNYSSLAFWRGWHRSFNQWIVRYMYIPLGGSTTALYNIWPIFTFVAIWHDIHLNMLLWSWLICLFILPEIVLSWLAQKRGWEGPQYRHWIAAAAGANMLLMSVANLVGFVVGASGIQTILGSLMSASGVLFVVALAGTCYCAAHVLLEIRETERSYGIFNKY